MVERNGMPRSTSQPTMQLFFLQVHSASAIDFAELRMRNAARSSAWQALHLSLTFSKLLATTPA